MQNWLAGIRIMRLRGRFWTLKKCNVSESEICLIGNICPEGTKEVYKIMHWLKEDKKKNGRVLRRLCVILLSSTNLKHRSRREVKMDEEGRSYALDKVCKGTTLCR